MSQPRSTTFRDLHAWQAGMDLVEAVYAYCRNLPSTERFGLSDQLRRAAVSVPTNIAEGYGRGYSRDCARFLSIALGSLREIETLLLICRRLSLGIEGELEATTKECSRAGGSLVALRNAIARRATPRH